MQNWANLIDSIWLKRLGLLITAEVLDSNMTIPERGHL